MEANLRLDELLSEADLLEAHAERTVPATWDAMSAKAMHYDSRRMHKSRRRPPKPPDSGGTS